MAEKERHVMIPLMVRSHDDIQFVEDDNDTVSDNELTSEAVSDPSNGQGNLYYEIQDREAKVDYLDVPRFSCSRTNSSPSNSSAQASPMLERKSSYRKKSSTQHDYEKLSVASACSKKSTVERIADVTFFRKRTDDVRRVEKGEDDEHILEALRQVVRKCTTVDPVKRPTSVDVMDLLGDLNDKS